MSESLEKAALDQLRTVEDPDLKKDLVTLGMIRDLQVDQKGNISLRVVLTTPACPLKEKIESDVRTALEKVAGLGSVDIKMDAEVRRKPNTPSQNTIPGVQNIIAVSSGKGGVGKSTVSCNLATSLALDGAKVGLMDADVYGPNIPTMMGAMEMPKIDKDVNGKEFFVPPLAQDVRVMSMGFLVEGDQPMVWRGPMLHNAINQFCHMVNWGNLDYLVVDMPPGTGDVQLSLSQLVPLTGAVMVTTPQEVSMQDVRKAFHMWDKVRVPILGVVENMSYFQPPNSDEKFHLFGKGGGKAVADKFGTTLLTELPIVMQVREGGDEGLPVVVRDPQTDIAKSFRELARKVAQQVSIAAAAKADDSQKVSIGKFS